MKVRHIVWKTGTADCFQQDADGARGPALQRELNNAERAILSCGEHWLPDFVVLPRVAPGPRARNRTGVQQ